MKTFLKQKEGSWNSSETSLPAEHSTRHGHADDSPSLKYLYGSHYLYKEITWHCQIGFHGIYWSCWEWKWGLRIPFPECQAFWNVPAFMAPNKCQCACCRSDGRHLVYWRGLLITGRKGDCHSLAVQHLDLSLLSQTGGRCSDHLQGTYNLVY